VNLFWFRIRGKTRFPSLIANKHGEDPLYRQFCIKATFPCKTNNGYGCAENFVEIRAVYSGY